MRFVKSARLSMAPSLMPINILLAVISFMLPSSSSRSARKSSGVGNIVDEPSKIVWSSGGPFAERPAVLSKGA